MDVILFLIFALIALVCGINVVLQTHPISSAVSLIGVMGSLAILYLQQRPPVCTQRRSATSMFAKYLS